MGVSTVTARIDSEDKIEFDKFCDNVGINTSSAINMFIKTVLREKTIPFAIKYNDPFYSKENQEYVLKSIKELEAGKGQVHDIIEAKNGK